MFTDNNKWFTITIGDNFMHCKKCGAALPSHGFICKSCGAMMDEEQIKMQKQYASEKNEELMEVSLMSDKYRREPINRDYGKRRENKYLGALLIVLVVIVLIVVAILKVM